MTLLLGTISSPPPLSPERKHTSYTNTLSSSKPSHYERFKPKYVVVVFLPPSGGNETPTPRFFISETKIKRKDFFNFNEGSWNVSFKEENYDWSSLVLQKKLRSNFFHYDMTFSILNFYNEIETKLKQLEPNCFYLFSRNMTKICEVQTTSNEPVYVKELDMVNSKLTLTLL